MFEKKVLIVWILSVLFLGLIIFILVNEKDFTKSGVILIEDDDNYSRIIWQNGDDKSVLEEKKKITMQEIVQYYKDNNEALKDNRGNEIAAFYGFENLRYSPTGRFLLYDEVTYEDKILKVYDLKRKGIVAELLNPQKYEFILDDKYFYSCVSEISQNKEAKVFETDRFKKVYDLYENEFNEGYVNLECEYLDDENAIEFDLFGPYFEKENFLEMDPKKEKYNLE
jgi:hypothetical protein